MSNDNQPPSGCRHCGLGHRLHFERWADAVGWHDYKRPTGRQILARMLARRAARTNTTTTRRGNS